VAALDIVTYSLSAFALCVSAVYVFILAWRRDGAVRWGAVGVVLALAAPFAWLWIPLAHTSSVAGDPAGAHDLELAVGAIGILLALFGLLGFGLAARGWAARRRSKGGAEN
jgi:hypothetical protein